MTEFEINKWIYKDFLGPLGSKIQEECLKMGLDLDLSIDYNEESKKIEIIVSEWERLENKIYYKR